MASHIIKSTLTERIIILQFARGFGKMEAIAPSIVQVSSLLAIKSIDMEPLGASCQMPSTQWSNCRLFCTLYYSSRSSFMQYKGI